MKLPRIPHVAVACIASLFLLAALMFIAMLVGKAPHPPSERGPYLAALGALAVLSVWLLLARERSGLWAGLVSLLAFIPAVGPHKFWLEPAARALAPLIVVGSLLIVAGALALMRAARAAPPAGD